MNTTGQRSESAANSQLHAGLQRRGKIDETEMPTCSVDRPLLGWLMTALGDRTMNKHCNEAAAATRAQHFSTRALTFVINRLLERDKT